MPGTEALRNLICRTHKLIVVVNINHTAHMPWLAHGWGLSKVGGGGGQCPPTFQSGGAMAPPAPPMSPPLICTHEHMDCIKLFVYIQGLKYNSKLCKGLAAGVLFSCTSVSDGSFFFLCLSACKIASYIPRLIKAGGGVSREPGWG